jgi:hypothetical protein
MVHTGLVFWLTVIVAVVFAINGLRFCFSPESAASTFGLTPPLAHELHVVVGIRNLWLAGLALALALLREWRALALWFALGSLVCVADSVIAVQASAPLAAVALHAGSAILFALLARGAALLARSR